MYLMVLLLEALYCVSNVRMISHQTKKFLLRKLSVKWIVSISNSSKIKTKQNNTKQKKPNKQKEKPWFNVVVHFNGIRTVLKEPIFILFE